jgi:hypothetical protein
MGVSEIDGFIGETVNREVQISSRIINRTHSIKMRFPINPITPLPITPLIGERIAQHPQLIHFVRIAELLVRSHQVVEQTTDDR